MPDQASVCKTIVVIPKPIINLGADTTICLGQSITFDAGACPGCTYVWSNITASQLNIGSGQTLTTNSAGIYSVAVTNSIGCTFGDTIQLSVIPIPQPTIMGPSLACLGSSGAYTTQPGMAIYQWIVTSGGIITGGLGTDSITVSWIDSGSQLVGVNYYDNNGCTAAEPSWIGVEVNPYPDTAGYITGLAQVCAGMNGIIYSVAPVVNAINYVWSLLPGTYIVSGSGTNSITVNFTINASSGDFIVHGNNLCGIGPSSPPYPVTVHQSPVAYAGPDTVICELTPYTVTSASASFYSSLHWTTTGNGTITRDTMMNPSYLPVPADTGQIILELTATGSPPCSDAHSQATLTYISKPSAFAGPDRVNCGRQPVLLSGSSASRYQSLQWETSGTGTFDDPHILHPIYFPGSTDSLNGLVILTLIAKVTEPCKSDTSELSLNIITSAVADAGPDATICQGMHYTLTNTNAENWKSISWSTSGSGIFSDPHALHPDYFPGVSDISNGTVILTLRAGSSDPCAADSDGMTLYIVKAPAVIAASGGSTCRKIPIEITGTSAQNYSAIGWYSSGYGTLSDANTLTPKYYPSVIDSGDIVLSVKAYGNPGCTDTFATAFTIIHIYQNIVADAGTDQSITSGSSAVLSGSASGGSGSFSFHWEPASLLETNNTSNPVTIVLTKDTLFFLIVTDPVSGCINSDTMKVNILNPVNPGESDCIIIHNVITPNGDGVNDTWIIDCIENFPDNSVQIFNRWGDKVNNFEHYNNTTVIWKGTDMKGEFLPDGTYYYILTIRNVGRWKGYVYIRSGLK